MAEHPFAQYVRILGKGKKGSRSLTQEEAFEAMSMILAGAVRPEQLGAFLMLLRVKEESPEELAGFIQATRLYSSAPETLTADLDWSTYAGKKRQLPWFLLAAFVLSENNVRVFMHGSKGHTQGRIYIEDTLSVFGLSAAQHWQQVDDHLKQQLFAYFSIDTMVPMLGEIIQLRSILGLRSPVHTLCRLINPLNAYCTIDGVFHPAYAPMHQQTSQLLGLQHGLTIRGDGGEAEVKPDSDCEVRWIRQGQLSDQQWQRIFPKRIVKDEALDPAVLLACWRGEVKHEYGEGAVISTLAALMVLLGKANQQEPALLLARTLWEQRNRQRFN